MKRSPIAYIAALTLVLALGGVACGEDSPPSINDTSWVLQFYGTQAAPQSPVDDSAITAEFDGAEAKLTGSAGCNSYFAEYAIEGDGLTFFALAWTERFCQDPDGVMDQELAYLTALGSVDRFEVVDTTLRLFYSGGVLVFEAQEGDSAP